MEFRPCIDIHNGKVKQIVGGSLRDEGSQARENFVSEQDAAFYAELYQRQGIHGGHVIRLNKEGTEYFEITRQQALSALRAYPGGLQIGGGIRDDNAADYLNAGASAVIVTSYVFRDGQMNWENLKKLEAAVGADHLVLDVSCRRKGDDYYIVTDRWQKFTDVVLTPSVLDELADHCAEFLVHAVDVEGKARGIEEPLVRMLGSWDGIPVTYAGGVGSFDDLRKRKNTDEIHMFTIAKKVDEAFQVPENKAYACREKHEMTQAEALEREMETFHRRRILCMVEIFSKIDCGILFSGYVELDTYFKNVWDYAHQRIAAEQLREVQEYLRSQIPWKSLSSQQMDLGAELLNFWCGEDELDWSYSQYFEIAAGNLKPFIAMTLFTEILCKHFPDVMSAPVKRLSSKL